VIDDLDAYYSTPTVIYEHAPLVLPPSSAKQLYGRPLADQWRGMALMASYWSGLSVIGYSLPPADPYARQILFRLADEYVRARAVGPHDGMRPIDVVSLKRTDWSRRQLRRTYRFLSRDHTKFSYDGFDDAAVDRLFQ
jgi:hypothetical protein